MPRTGRPTDYSEELVSLICQRISGGESLRKICSSEGMPVINTVWTWLNKYADFSQRYARAREEQADLFAEEIIELADMAMEAKDNVQAQAYRLRVDARKWVASKLKPKSYGDRVEANISGALEIAQIQRIVVDKVESK